MVAMYLLGRLGSSALARALHVTPGSSLNAVGGMMERLHQCKMELLRLQLRGTMAAQSPCTMTGTSLTAANGVMECLHQS